MMVSEYRECRAKQLYILLYARGIAVLADSKNGMRGGLPKSTANFDPGLYPLLATASK